LAATAVGAGVGDFVAPDAAHVVEIEAGVREADAGDFATDAEVAAVFARGSAVLPR
jgi:predicted transcriptional regulator